MAIALAVMLIILGAGAAGGMLWFFASLAVEYRDELAEVRPLLLCIVAIGALGVAAVLVRHVAL